MGSDIPVKEIKISVPWGHIAGKFWGKEGYTPVVMIHGILDNCCSFQRLIPLLNLNNFCFIAVDLPNHGKSSSITTSVPINLFDYVFSIETLINHFSLKEFYMIGHSLGAQISILYSAIYPEKVTKLVLLDGAIYKNFIDDIFYLEIRKRFDLAQKIMKSPATNRKSYKIEEIVDNLIRKRPSQLSRENARLLVERSVIQTSNGYQLMIDPRLKNSVSPMLSLEQLLKIYKIVCKRPVLLILTEGTFETLKSKGLEFLDFLKSYMKYVIVKGDHDVHLEHPERVSDIISTFLDPTKSHI